MIGFVFGVLVGFGVKMAYDFVQEERIPADLGMAQGRNEAILDETRQIVRELRDDVRRAIRSAAAADTVYGGARQGSRGSARQESGAGASTSEL